MALNQLSHRLSAQASDTTPGKQLPRTLYDLISVELANSGQPSIGQSANQLKIPVRTLQRRLHQCGISHSTLVHQVRCELACEQLLNNSISVAEIATNLGYTDPSHFSRAFRQWTGLSPSEFRRARQK